MRLLLLLVTATTGLTGQPLSFLFPQYIPMGNGCCSVLTGDFNQDGKADIAVAHSIAGLTILLGDGKGGFTRIETAPVVPPAITIQGLVAVADINADGIPDIIAIANAPGVPLGATIALLGRGDGTFQTPLLLDRDTVKAVGDFNGDGRPDLLVYTGYNPGENPGNFAIRFGNGDGTFRPIGPTTSFPVGDFRFALIADFNGDGKADLAQTSFRPNANGFVYVWLGNGDGSFRTVEPVQLSGNNPSAYLAVGDFNGDGKPDLAVTEVLGTGEHGVELLLGNGDGSFRKGTTSPANTPESLPVLVADVDGDGRMDLATGFTLLLGNGDGTLQPPVAFGQFFEHNNTTLFSALAVADFNGDGKLDLVAGGGDGTQLSILIGNASAMDSSVNAVSAATYAGTVAPGSIATLFGKDLAATTASASGLELPVILGNTRVRVRDEAGVERLAGLIYVSPSQINFLMPSFTAVGPNFALSGYAIFNVDNGAALHVEGARSTLVQTLAPGFFTADATAVRVQSDGSQTPVSVFECSSTGSCALVPIDLSAEGTVYLTLYGTGFRYADSAICVIGSKFASVSYSGPQPVFPGLDQLNVPLPKTLPSGTANSQCSFRIGSTNESASARFTISIK